MDLDDEILHEVPERLSFGKFRVGQFVRKVSGHCFQGKVVSVFWTLGDQRRLVVESTVDACSGLLFIFRPDQLEVVE